MAGIIGDWIIRPENRYVVEHSYRGGKTQFETLDTKLSSFQKHGLVDRIRSSPLGDMYDAMSYFQYGYALPYHLLVRSVYTDKDDELLIRLGDTTCRFGRTEFALISGLSFKELELVGRSVEEVSHSSLIAHRDAESGIVDMSRAPFFGPLKDITISKLEDALVNATDPEIAYKVGLIYFIEAVMHGKLPRTPVSPFVFGLVEDTSRFLSFPWGRYFWDLSMDIWKRKRDLMRIPLKVKGKDSKKDDIASLMVVFFVWAYETLPSSVVNKLAVKNNEVSIPRVLRWRPHMGRVQEKTLSRLLEDEALDVKRYLEPNEAEARMLRDNGLTDDEIKSQPPIYPPPVVAPPAPVAPPPTIHATTDATTHACTSSQAAPIAALDIHSDIIDLRNTINNVVDEMRGKIEIVMGYVRRYRQESIHKIDDLRNELTVSNELMIRLISANKAEGTEQNRVILAALHRIWGVISRQIRFGGHCVDPDEPSHAAAQPEYQHEHQPAYQPAFQHEPDHQKGVDASLPEVLGDESRLSEANTTAFVEEMLQGIKDPYTTFNDVLETEDTFSSGDDSMWKIGIDTIGPCESSIAKKRRVKYIESIQERTVKFMKWYNAPNSLQIIIPTSTEVSSDREVIAKPFWFEELLTDKGRLHELHVDAYVNLLKRRMAAQPDAFKRGSVVLHYEFATSMAESSLPHPALYAHVWRPHTTAYTLWRIESDHWVAVGISIKDWTIYVYDSLDGYENKDMILRQLHGWTLYMRVVLQAAPLVQDLPEMVDASEPVFKIDLLHDLKLPQMKGRRNSAVYALKYIEDMVTVGHLRGVSNEDMMGLRRQISADLYCQYYGNYGSC